MQSLSISILTLLHITGYGLVFTAVGASATWEAVAFGGLLIWVSVIDADRYEIPDAGAFLLALSGLIHLLGQNPTEIIDGVLGAIIWPLLFWALAYGYLRVRGFHGLGFGDVKLMCGIGAWCGFLATIHVVLAASLTGVIILMLRAVRTHNADLSQSMVAFGPFLCLSAWTIWLAGG